MKNLTLEEFKKIHEEWKSTELSIRDYCHNTGFEESKFYYWQKRIRNEAAKSNGDFLPVSINKHGGKVVLVGSNRQQVRVGHLGMMQSNCEIVFPNGITARLSGDVAASILGQLLMMNRYLKLEQGYIHLPDMAEWEEASSVQTAWSDLVMMVEGIYPDTCKRSKRWKPKTASK